MNPGFKIKLNFKGRKIKTGEGLYAQLRKKPEIIVGTPGPFSINPLKEAIDGLYNNQKQPEERKIKIVTNQAGFDLFQKAIKEQLQKQTKNEYRKRFSIESKILKQTYKFGQ